MTGAELIKDCFGNDSSDKPCTLDFKLIKDIPVKKDLSFGEYIGRMSFSDPPESYTRLKKMLQKDIQFDLKMLQVLINFGSLDQESMQKYKKINTQRGSAIRMLEHYYNA